MRQPFPHFAHAAPEFARSRHDEYGKSNAVSDDGYGFLTMPGMSRFRSGESRHGMGKWSGRKFGSDALSAVVSV